MDKKVFGVPVILIVLATLTAFLVIIPVFIRLSFMDRQIKMLVKNSVVKEIVLPTATPTLSPSPSPKPKKVVVEEEPTETPVSKEEL